MHGRLITQGLDIPLHSMLVVVKISKGRIVSDQLHMVVLINSTGTTQTSFHAGWGRPYIRKILICTGDQEVTSKDPERSQVMRLLVPTSPVVEK
jgi:hypothetical protein